METILITTSSFDKANTGLVGLLESRGYRVVLNPFGRKLSEDEVLKLVVDHQPVGMIAGVEPLTDKVLALAEKLKVISRCGIGLDSVDLDAAKELNITVTNTPDAPTMAVAELTLGMILSLLRSIHLSDSSIREGNWLRPTGNLLHKKCVGIIGCGRIGSRLAHLLGPFECRVLGCDIVCGEDECNYEPKGLDTIFTEADIITLHIPYSAENHHFINAERINMMKNKCIIVNTARGGLIDEDALYEALKDSRLGGAALDSFEEEPYRGALKTINNVLLTAHIGSYAQEGRIMMESQAVNNLIEAL
jgi:D-3-phosphoglycerate dehydrogenase / 2-oxoglutarate reductase